MKNLKTSGMELILLLIFTSVVLAGCVNSDQNNSGTGTSNGQNQSMRQFGQNRTSNLTAEQRQQLVNERLQQAENACQGKAEGDACSIQSPRGSRAGTCKTQQDKLLCSTGFRGQNGPLPSPTA